jgi:hypothetical protein
MTHENAIEAARKMESESGVPCAAVKNPKKEDDWLVVIGIRQDVMDKNPHLFKDLT